MGWNTTSSKAIQLEGDEGITYYTFDVSYTGQMAFLYDTAAVELNVRDLTTDETDRENFSEVPEFGNLGPGAWGTLPFSRTSTDKNGGVVEVGLSGYQPGDILFSVTVGIQGDRAPEAHEIFAVDLASASWHHADTGLVAKETDLGTAYGVVWNDDDGWEGPAGDSYVAADDWFEFEQFSEYDRTGLEEQFGPGPHLPPEVGRDETSDEAELEKLIEDIEFPVDDPIF